MLAKRLVNRRGKQRRFEEEGETPGYRSLPVITARCAMMAKPKKRFARGVEVMLCEALLRTASLLIGPKKVASES